MKTKTPNGVRDLLHEDLVIREKIIAKIKTVFESYNYERIRTPVLEFYDTLEKGLSPELKEKSVTFIDHTGERMILRPDMTTPIARVIATRMKNDPAVSRLYYLENIFRRDEISTGSHSEFLQIGLELIGSPGEKADNEVIEIAQETLEAIGLKNFKVDVGNINDFDKFTEDQKQKLSNLDFVSLNILPKKEMLVLKDFDYYTGMIFECYIPEMGCLLGSGGRYDNLISNFGLQKPAVGFAFNLERLITALQIQQSGEK